MSVAGQGCDTVEVEKVEGRRMEKCSWACNY